MAPQIARLLALCTALTVPAVVSAQQPTAQEVELGSAAPDGGVPLDPPVLVTDSPAAWPAALEDETVAGVVGLELLVDGTGHVQDTSVVRGAHPLLDAAAVAASRGLVFLPARLGGEPVAVRLAFEYRFTRPPPQGVLSLEVRERGTRKPIAGAQLFSGEDEVGVTDAQGHVRVSAAPGEQSWTISASGYAPAVVSDKVVSKEEHAVLVRLRPEGVGSFESVVIGDKLQTDLGRVALQDAELREVPGTMGDPLRVVMLMPGVAQVASGAGYPVVRGSLPAATATFVDGVRVPILFHLLLGPSVVHPEALDRIDFTPGLPSARRGRLLAGTVEASLRPVEEPFRAHVGADLINAGGVVRSRIEGTGTELLAGGRFSYTPWLIAQAGLLSPGPSGGRGRADFFDYVVSARQPWGGGSTRLLALGSSDLVGVDLDDPDAADVAMITRFHRMDVRHRQPLGVGELELGISAGTQTAGIEGKQRDTRMDLLLDQNDAGARASWSAALGVWDFAAGADVERIASGTRVGTEATITPLLAAASHGTQAGLWSELSWTDGGWNVTAGARGDLFHLVPGITHWSVDPRVSIRRAIGSDWTLQLAAGTTHQAPTALLPVPVVELSALRHGLQMATQVDASVQWRPLPGVDVHVNGYAALLNRTVELDLERIVRDLRASGRLTADPASHGSAAGLELMVRKHLGGNWYGWASYALQRSTREVRYVDFDARGMPVGEHVREVPFAFDQTHIGNVALSVRLPGDWTVGGVIRAQTGRPESGQLSSRTQVESVDPVTGRPVWRPASGNELGRLPPFVRLDLRAAKRWTFDDASLELSLDVMNASLSQEVLGYSYGFAATDGEPVLQRSAMSFPLILPILGLKADL